MGFWAHFGTFNLILTSKFFISSYQSNFSRTAYRLSFGDVEAFDQRLWAPVMIVCQCINRDQRATIKPNRQTCHARLI